MDDWRRRVDARSWSRLAHEIHGSTAFNQRGLYFSVMSNRYYRCFTGPLPFRLDCLHVTVKSSFPGALVGHKYHKGESNQLKIHLIFVGETIQV